MPGSIWVRGEGGQVWEMDLPLPDGIAHRIRTGNLSRVNPDGSTWDEPAADETADTDAPADDDLGPVPGTGQPEPGPAGPVEPGPAAVPALPDAPPAVNATKAAWVGWAVRCGATPEVAEAVTRADLIQKYGNRQ